MGRDGYLAVHRKWQSGDVLKQSQPALVVFDLTSMIQAIVGGLGIGIKRYTVLLSRSHLSVFSVLVSSRWKELKMHTRCTFNGCHNYKSRRRAGYNKAKSRLFQNIMGNYAQHVDVLYGWSLTVFSTDKKATETLKGFW